MYAVLFNVDTGHVSYFSWSWYKWRKKCCMAVCFSFTDELWMVVSYPDESTWNILAIWEVYRNTFFFQSKQGCLRFQVKSTNWGDLLRRDHRLVGAFCWEEQHKEPKIPKNSPCQGLLYVPFGGVKHHPPEAVISNQPLFAMSNGDIANHGFGRKPLEHADLIYRQSIQHMIALFVFLKSWFVPMVGECKNRGISSI